MRHLLILLILSVLSCKDHKKVNALDESFDLKLLNEMTAKIQAQEYPNIHSILIAKNGSLIYEEYFEGKDQSFGEDLGIVKHNSTSLHDIRSISKSVISILVGICIDQGLIKGIDEKIASFYPEYTFEGDKTKWTIAHFLTMTTGLRWDELEISYENPNNDEIKMNLSDDPIRYVFNKPIESVPGDTWNYNTGATQILANIVERVSNQTILEYARKNLFNPLKINKVEWIKMTKDGGSDNYSGGSGLRLTSRDLLKIGLLYRDKGKFNNNLVLSKKWVESSIDPKIIFEFNGFECKYGYQFWMWSNNSIGRKTNYVVANGNGDQKIYWDFENDIIIITTAGNYNKYIPEANSDALLRDYIYPAFFND